MTEQKIRFYMDLAFHMGKQGTCPRANVGAVIVRDDRVIAMGFNGSPRHTPHCKDDGCWMRQRGELVSCVRSVHAESNSIVNAAYMGTVTKGSVMFSTHYPCLACMKLIINAGITQVYYSIPYDDPDAKILEAAAKTAAVLEITQVDGPKE